MRVFRPLAAVVCAVALFCADERAQAAPPQTPAAEYRIAGTLVNATTGEPVRRATIALLAAEGDGHTIASAKSDNEGRFALNHLPAAKYQLTASKRGFRTAFYDEHDEFNSAIVTGPDQDTEQLIFRMPEGATLHGVITADGGDPVEGARVMLFLVPADHGQGATSRRSPSQRISQADSTTTDDTGNYEFGNLAAGNYLVAVMAEPWYAVHKLGSGDEASALDMAYPVTYYDSTTEAAAATPILIAAGAHDEANISLHAVPALHLAIPIATNTQERAVPGLGLQQSIFGVQVPFDGAANAIPGRPGWAEFVGVAPGRYELNESNPARIVELDATANRQVDPAEGTTAVPVSGSLVNVSGAPLADEITVALYAVEGTQRPEQLVSIASQGRFQFESVPPGRWELWAWGAGAPAAVIAVGVNGKQHRGSMVSVADRPISLTASIDMGSAKLRGIARKGGKGTAGVLVVLAPKDASSFEPLVRRDQSDSDGSFSLNNIVPGSYTVIAIENGWALDWSRAETFAPYLARGIGVTVPANSTGTIQMHGPVPVQAR